MDGEGESTFWRTMDGEAAMSMLDVMVVISKGDYVHDRCDIRGRHGGFETGDGFGFIVGAILQVSPEIVRVKRR
jgi:hypothetical protein